LRFRSRPR